MDYPQPDERVLQEWERALEVLRETLACSCTRLRAAYRGAFQVPDVILSEDATASDENGGNSRDAMGETLLEECEALVIRDLAQDARWAAPDGQYRGPRAYLGLRISWPDGEPFGALEAHFSSPLDAAGAERCLRAVEAARTAITLRLELLYRDHQASAQANEDPLTGLANYRLFDEITRHHIERSRRSGAELWMLRWGIDGLPELRRSLGRDEADRLVRSAAERARSCIRRSDVLGRVRQDRFGLLLLDANEFVATAVSDRIRRNTRRVRASGGSHPGLDLSFGISPYAPGEALRAWQQRVELALQRAQEAGGGQGLVLRP